MQHISGPVFTSGVSKFAFIMATVHVAFIIATAAVAGAASADQPVAIKVAAVCQQVGGAKVTSTFGCQNVPNFAA